MCHLRTICLLRAHLDPQRQCCPFNPSPMYQMVKRRHDYHGPRRGCPGRATPAAYDSPSYFHCRHPKHQGSRWNQFKWKPGHVKTERGPANRKHVAVVTQWQRTSLLQVRWAPWLHFTQRSPSVSLSSKKLREGLIFWWNTVITPSGAWAEMKTAFWSRSSPLGMLRVQAWVSQVNRPAGKTTFVKGAQWRRQCQCFLLSFFFFNVIL